MCWQKIQSVISRVFPPHVGKCSRAERWSPLWSCISTHTGGWLVRCHCPSPPGSSSMPRLGSRLGGHPGTLDVRSKYICGCSIQPSLWDRLPSPGCCLHAKLGCLLLQDPTIPSLPFPVSPETSLPTLLLQNPHVRLHEKAGRDWWWLINLPWNKNSRRTQPPNWNGPAGGK